MTTNCDLKFHPRVCVVTRATRPRIECSNCPDGIENLRKHQTAKGEPERIAIPPAQFINQKPETITPPKETPVPEKMTTKERVSAGIQRRGSARPTILMQTCHVSADELKAVLGELEREGKIKSWPYRGRSGMTAVYTLPDAKDPRTPEMLAGDRTAKKKAAAAVAGPAAIPVPRDGSAPPAPRKPAGNVAGLLNIDEMIAFLEEKRAAIDTAIAGLRALA